MKTNKKPVTLILYMVILIFLVLGTRIFLMGSDKNEPFNGENAGQDEKWTGIITLWDIPYVETGVGSNSSWLSSRIQEFERENPGIFIDVRRMTPQRAAMYFTGDVEETILPDIVSLSPYDEILSYSRLQDLESYFTEENLDRITPFAKKFMYGNGSMMGIPYMMGTYALYTNKEMLEEHGINLEGTDIQYTTLDRVMEKFPYIEKERKREILYYGFGTYCTPYSNPIISMIYYEGDKIEENVGYRYVYSWMHKQDAVPKGIRNMDSTAAIELFLSQGRIGVFLGSTRVLYRNRALSSQGKGLEMGVYTLPMVKGEGIFQDQVAVYGIINKENKVKLSKCADFLQSLLSMEAQADLGRIGMFPIVNDVGFIYEDDPEMLQLEENISNFRYSPKDEFWIKNRQELLKVLPENSQDENS